jgi:hypothetical protein
VFAPRDKAFRIHQGGGSTAARRPSSVGGELEHREADLSHQRRVSWQLCFNSQSAQIVQGLHAMDALGQRRRFGCSRPRVPGSSRPARRVGAGLGKVQYAKSGQIGTPVSRTNSQ